MSKTDILTLLTHDHREVEASLQSLITHAGTSAIVDSDRVRKLIDALDLHTKIEEAYLYPKAEKEREASNLVQDFYSEHREIKGLLTKLEHCQDNAELTRLGQEILTHLQLHVQDEENQLFPLLRRQWEVQVLVNLGEQMQELKEREMSGH